MSTPAFLAALVQLPPVGDALSPYQVSPPAPAWPIPQLPLNALSLDGDLSDEQEEYAQNVYVYHLINAATASANATKKDAIPRHQAHYRLRKTKILVLTYDVYLY